MTNFSHSEFATSNGEFNVDLRALLTIQAYRSWCGDEVGVADGCRDNWATDSAHSIYLLKTYDKDDEKHVITIPATGYDITRKGMTTWELMDEIEKWVDSQIAILAAWNNYRDGNDEDVFEDDRILSAIKYPIFTGRGCYPDTNNQCVHLDMGHLSLNPVLRDKRKAVTRWVRVNGVYHYANEGESFSDMKKRLGL